MAASRSRSSRLPRGYALEAELFPAVDGRPGPALPLDARAAAALVRSVVDALEARSDGREERARPRLVPVP